MAYYFRLGNIPEKRHIQFRKPDGSLYHEELVSSLGFSGIYSNLYHIHPPTRVAEVGPVVSYKIKIAEDYPLKQTHLNTSGITTTGDDYLVEIKVLMVNDDIAISICHPSGKPMDYYYKN